MNTSNAAATAFKEAVQGPRFRLQPPLGNPFVSSSGVAVTQLKDGVEVEVAKRPYDDVGSDDVLEGILARTRRDVERYPASARAHSNLGLALLNRGDAAAAIREFEIALQCEPNNYVAAVNLAGAKMETGDIDEAERLYRTVLDRFRDDESSLMNLAFIQIRRGDFEYAAKLLRRVVEQNEEEPLPRYHLAMVLLKLNRPNEAISHLKIAARGDVRSPELHHALGVAYTIGGRLKQAARAFRTALTLAPNSPDSVHGLALVFLQEGELQSVVGLLQQHLERNSEDQSGREILARAYFQLRQFERARVQLNQVLRYEGVERDKAEQARLRNNIGICFASEGDWAEAEKWFRDATDLEPNNAVPYVNRARLLLGENLVDQAVTLLELGKRRFSNDEQTLMLLAISYERLGFYDKAAVQLASLVERGVASPVSLAYFGALLAERRGDYARAIRIFEEGIRKFPSEPAIINNYAYTCLMNGNVEDARRLLSSLPRGVEPYPELLATTGLLRLWEGDFQQGEEYYQNAAALASSLGNAALARNVRQKMHLELARAYQRRNDFDVALRHVRAGLAVKQGRDDYRRDLSSFQDKLSAGRGKS